MREYITEIDRWITEGKAFSAATVTNTWGSAPRPIGTMMFVGPDLEMLGSVSGGCVEGVVLKEADETSQSAKIKNLKMIHSIDCTTILSPCPMETF